MELREPGQPRPRTTFFLDDHGLPAEKTFSKMRGVVDAHAQSGSPVKRLLVEAANIPEPIKEKVKETANQVFSGTLSPKDAVGKIVSFSRAQGFKDLRGEEGGFSLRTLLEDYSPLFSKFHNTGISFGFLPEPKEASAELTAAFEKLLDFEGSFFKEDPEKTMTLFAEYLKHFVTASMLREKEWSRHLKEPRDEEEPHFLVQLGGMHGRIAEGLKDHDVGFSSVEEPFILNRLVRLYSRLAEYAEKNDLDVSKLSPQEVIDALGRDDLLKGMGAYIVAPFIKEEVGRVEKTKLIDELSSHVDEVIFDVARDVSNKGKGFELDALSEMFKLSLFLSALSTHLDRMGEYPRLTEKQIGWFTLPDEEKMTPKFAEHLRNELSDGLKSMLMKKD